MATSNFGPSGGANLMNLPDGGRYLGARAKKKLAKKRKQMEMDNCNSSKRNKQGSKGGRSGKIKGCSNSVAKMQPIYQINPATPGTSAGILNLI